jgi:hypothetical protein
MEVSKVAANASTKLQVNYGKDGVLVNIYADNQGELETLLASVQDLSSLINSVNSTLRGTPTIAAITEAFNATPVAAPVSAGGEETVNDKYGNIWVYNHPSAPECSRGKMVLKHGKAQATGKPYKGWFDPATGPKWTGAKVPKDQQAATIWA